MSLTYRFITFLDNPVITGSVATFADLPDPAANAGLAMK